MCKRGDATIDYHYSICDDYKCLFFAHATSNCSHIFADWKPTMNTVKYGARGKKVTYSSYHKKSTNTGMEAGDVGDDGLHFFYH